MQLENKVVLITGASRGLGKAIACKFALNGANIILNYYQSDSIAKQLASDLEKKYSVQVLLIQADVGKEKDVQRMVKQSIDRFGKIDILVNNAGIAIDKEFDDKNVSDFEEILRVNLLGTFLVSKYVGKHMLEKKTGKIINITSTNALNTYYPMSLDYDASKAGVISLTHNLAFQYAPYVTVNAIASGWINTDMNQNMDPEFRLQEEEKIYLKRFAQPEEIADVVLFLSSSMASYINSSVIRVDGGSIHE